MRRCKQQFWISSLYVRVERISKKTMQHIQDFVFLSLQRRFGKIPSTGYLDPSLARAAALDLRMVCVERFGAQLLCLGFRPSIGSNLGCCFAT